MKKLFSIISAGLLLLGAVSCVQDELTTFDPAKATAPVLGSYEVGEKAVTATYTPGVFKVGFNEKMPVNHSLAIVSVDGKAISKTLSSTAKDGEVSATLVNISKALVALGYAQGTTVNLELAVRASMQETSRDNGRNGFVDSQGHIVLNGFEVNIPEIEGSPYAELNEDSDWSVIGALSKYGIDWNGDLNMWTDGSVHVAAHVALAASDEFKFRKGQDWAENMGGTFGSVDSEFEVTQDGPNIVVGVEGVYDLWYDSDRGVAWVTEAFDPYPEYTKESNWTIIGKIVNYANDWNKDYPMVSDGTNHLALGIVISEEDEFKFRQDADWAVNLGGEFSALGEDFSVTQDGPNIKLGAAGTYDVFVNPTDGTARIEAASGAKVSSKIGSGEDEPGTTSTWSLVGTLGGTNWDTDIDMVNTSGDIWMARNVEVTASDEFKIRADHSWDTNFGGPEGNSTSTIDSENPYPVYTPVVGEAFKTGDKNIQIGVAGHYDITFDNAAGTILIEEHVAAYSLIGEINGDSWSKDVVMTESNGIWTSPVVNITGGFKIRFDFSWEDANTYGVEEGFTPEVGTPFTAVQPGKDITVPEAGNYKVTFNPETKEVLIKMVAFSEQLYMIGEEFGGWDWSSDGVVEMIPVLHNPEWGSDAEGQFWTVRYITAGKGFKFSPEKKWGNDFWGLSTNEGFSESSGNCVVSEDGYYMVHVDLKRENVHVEPARIYGIGDCFGGWDEGMEGALFQADGKTLKATVAAEGDVRMYAASSIATSPWWSREFVFFDGQIAYRGAGDEQARVKVLKGQTVSLDFNAGTAAVTGEGEASELPETMYIIGDGVGGWDWDADYIVDMVPVNGKAGQFWSIRYIESGKGFKFCSQKAWSGDFTGLGEDSGYTVDGGNCFVSESGIYMIYVDTDNKKLCIEPAKVYGIGDCFGGWDEGMEGALFKADGQTLKGTTSAAGEIRLYAASSAATSDWWTREFVFFDGKIAYRGNGGDQDRVSVDAGKTVTLDFNAGTATVE